MTQPVSAEAAEGADLLVVGNRGHGGLAEALLGSVGQYCVRHAPCPRRHHARQAGRRRLEISVDPSPAGVAAAHGDQGRALVSSVQEAQLPGPGHRLVA